MFRLTREVRFAINPPQMVGAIVATAPRGNSYGGIPAALGWAIWSSLRVTLSGTPAEKTQYLCDIKQIDTVVRRVAVPIVAQAAEMAWQKESSTVALSPQQVLSQLWSALMDAWPGARLDALQWGLTPLFSLTLLRGQQEEPMLRMSQKFEFAASHRLYNPAMDEQQNFSLFGKCSNPRGHGHNYELEVSVELSEGGEATTSLPALQGIVAEQVVERFDHKNLNVEIEEFRQRIPTVENIAATIYGILKPAVAKLKGVRLAAVTVWETPKTWCQYSE
jgi:6-pyruvoyltetrahydropterin/6-carboxytetrahydropterin synthase